MLNHHLIHPQVHQQHFGQLVHYLSLGAHQSPYHLNQISSFSVITLQIKQRLPQLQHHEQHKVDTFLVVMKGELKVDGKIANLEENKLICNPKVIINESQADSTFLYIVTKINKKNEETITIQNTIEQQTINCSNSLFYLIDGDASIEEQNLPVQLKQKSNVGPLPLIYLTAPTKVTIAPNSTYIIINDKPDHP